MVNVFIRQRILREPPPVKFVVTTSAVVCEIVSDEYLILLTVEVVAVVRPQVAKRCPNAYRKDSSRYVRGRCSGLSPRHARFPDDRSGNTNLGVVAGCCHDSSAAERRTLEYSVGFCVRTVCKRTPNAKPQSSAFTAESFVPSARYEYFATIVSYLTKYHSKKRGAKAPLSIKNLDVFVLVFSPSCKASTTKLQNRKKQERLSIGRLRTSENRKMADMPFEGWQ